MEKWELKGTIFLFTIVAFDSYWYAGAEVLNMASLDPGTTIDSPDATKAIFFSLDPQDTVPVRPPPLCFYLPISSVPFWASDQDQ